MTLEERAEKARKELFVRYDKLNALWTKAEEQITKFHIPRPVQFTYRSYPLDEFQDPNGPQVCHCLGLQKLKGKWRICLGTFVESSQCPEEEPSWTQVLECSAEERIDAAKHIPKFRQKVVESAEKFIPKVDEAIAAISEALGTDIADLLAERAKLNGRAK